MEEWRANGVKGHAPAFHQDAHCLDLIPVPSISKKLIT